MATNRKKYSAIIYEESCPDIVSAIKSFAESVVRFAYIYHDRDYEYDGTLKKPHFHLFIEYDREVASSTFENRFGTLIHQSVKSMEGCIIYMTHMRDLTKTQYSYKEIKYMNVDVENIILNCEGAEDSEMSVLVHILAYIKSERPKFNDLVEWVLNYGYYYVFRSNYQVIRDYIKNN